MGSENSLTSSLNFGESYPDASHPRLTKFRRFLEKGEIERELKLLLLRSTLVKSDALIFFFFAVFSEMNLIYNVKYVLECPSNKCF